MHPAAGADARAGEMAIDLPRQGDAAVYFIGTIRSPWTNRADCPKRGDPVAGAVCRIEVLATFAPALAGIEDHPQVQLLCWMHLARRDLVRQSPRSDGETRGTFALRSPVRFNPVASSVVALVGREGDTLLVRGLDCVDGTPLIDIKPAYREEVSP